MSRTNKSNKFTLLIDMDGVCAEIHGQWLNLYNREYNDNLTQEQIVSWDLHKYVKEDCGEKIYDYLEEPGFFLSAPIMLGCAKSLKTLKNAGLNIILVTASPYNSPTAYYEKIKWIKRNLPFLDSDNFVSTYIKDVIRGDLLLDDAIHNLDVFPGISCAFRQPWNREKDYRFSVNSWEEFTELALSLAKMGDRAIIDSEYNV